MKKATKTITLYKYEELNVNTREKIKIKYLEDMRQINVQEFEYMCNQILKDMFPNSELFITFDLSYSQGDYLGFYGDICLMDILNYFLTNGDDSISFTEIDLNWLKNFFRNYYDYYTIPNPENHHYLKHNFLENVDFYDEDGLSDNHFDFILERFNALCNKIYDDFCHDYTAYGYQYFYEISDTDMSDISEDYGWYYDDRGGIHTQDEFSEIIDC